MVEIRNVKAYYKIGADLFVKAVDGVSVSFETGKITGIAGESGCGKSTLLKVCIGWIKPPLSVLAGEVIYKFDGERVNILDLDEDSLQRYRWNLFAVVPQAAMNSLNPVRKLKKIFEETMRKFGIKKLTKEDEKTVEKVISDVGLPKEVLNMYPPQLSGGMKQRIIMALAIIAKPKVIFCDEPTTGLDLVTQKGILLFLREIKEKYGITIVLISHDMGVHAQITDNLAIMYAGKLIEYASTKEIFRNPLHPYTKALINSLPTIGEKEQKEKLPGAPPPLLNPPSGCRFHPRCMQSADICRKEVPELKEVKPGHYVACHRVGEV
ncbi:MAG TPA: ABC transporter ATP-binding protein [Thermotogales bacterium]|nr:ABC transporter ATP-binding protein [Thermotogales bacterium]